MDPFNGYSFYYNMLYKDKDYRGEVEYIDKLIKENVSEAKTILDLGCGTGNHAQLLAERNYKVNGVDVSENMLSIAKQIPPNPNLSFQHGDIRSLSLGIKYDIVLSLFHVMSYQTKTTDLLSAFHTLHNHLNESGVFLFDCWFGPAVMKSPPSVRIKRLEDDMVRIIRIAEPVMYPTKNTVDVNYEMIVQNKLSGVMSTFKETHTMRYLFVPEIEILLRQAKLTMIACEEWMTRKKPDFDTWNIMIIGKISPPETL